MILEEENTAGSGQSTGANGQSHGPAVGTDNTQPVLIT